MAINDGVDKPENWSGINPSLEYPILEKREKPLEQLWVHAGEFPRTLSEDSLR